jgi:hypothetical protein
MDTNTTTLEQAPLRRRPWGYWIALSALALALVAVLGFHLRHTARLKARLFAEAEGARACARQRDGLSAEVASRKAPAPAAPAPVEPSLLALRASAPPAAPAATAPVAEVAENPGPPPSQEAVLSLIRGGQARLQACYQKALRRDPALGLRPLRLRLAFTVRAGGDVGGIRFVPSPGGELVRCLREVVDDWRVPAFAGPSIAVEVPITLSPQG